jgi:hypothetical protein
MIEKYGWIFFALAGVANSVAALEASPPGKDASAIAVSIEGAAAQRLDAAALARLPQHTIHAEAHGNAITCEGPALIDVLAAARAPHGDALRGGNLALYVRIGAADGYRAVFALAELDPGFRDALPIITGRCDNAPLDAHDGPFRLVVPGEKRPARWVRQVATIDVLRAP